MSTEIVLTALNWKGWKEPHPSNDSFWMALLGFEARGFLSILYDKKAKPCAIKINDPDKLRKYVSNQPLAVQEKFKSKFIGEVI